MAKPKKEFVFLPVATEKRFSKEAVYIWHGWASRTRRTRTFVIYVGSTRKGSEGGGYGKSKFKREKVENLKRTYLHLFSEEDWEDGDTVEFTTHGLRACETRAIKAIKKFLGRHGAEFKVLNINKASRGCLTGKCRGNGCTKCCGAKLPTKLPSMHNIVKKILGEILDD